MVSGYIMDLRGILGPRPLIMAAAGVILVNKVGHILLQHRSDNDQWGLPGGSMELGETFEDTARREVLEETGLTVGKLEPFYLHSGPDSFYEYPNGHQVYLAAVVYKTTEFSGELRVADEESLEIRWFHPAEIPQAINPLDKPVIEFYLKTLGYCRGRGCNLTRAQVVSGRCRAAMMRGTTLDRPGHADARECNG